MEELRVVCVGLGPIGKAIAKGLLEKKGLKYSWGCGYCPRS
jgi:pyrroline-5-carboxylate reductase